MGGCSEGFPLHLGMRVRKKIEPSTRVLNLVHGQLRPLEQSGMSRKGRAPTPKCSTILQGIKVLEYGVSGWSFHCAKAISAALAFIFAISELLRHMCPLESATNIVSRWPGT